MPIPSLTIVLLLFLAGFTLHRHRTVLIAVAVALTLGVLLSGTWVGSVVHTLDRVFSSLT